MNGQERIAEYSSKYNSLIKKALKYFNTSDTENIVFSPYSILLLMTMITQQTDGRTRQEILDALGTKLSGDEFLKMVQELYRTLSEKHPVSDETGDGIAGGAVKAANAVFVRDDMKGSLNPEYASKLGKADSLYAELFSSASLTSDINDWVKLKTDGMITDISSDSLSEALFCILNAVAFEQEWEEEFEEDDTYEGEFRNLDGSVSEVTYLDSCEDVYIEDTLYTGFAKPYKGGKYSYVAILPKRKSAFALKRVIESLDFGSLKDKSSYRDVIVTMPEFEGDFDSDLSGFIKGLGAQTIFTPEADFSPMSDVALKLDSIIHKAHIEVDRQGTKAAAVTMEVVCAGAAPDMDEIRYVTLDRSFVYAIVNNETGLPVFVGVVKKL